LSSPVVVPAHFVTQAEHRVLNLYAATVLLMLIVIALISVYAIRLGPLVGPGVEQSFGLAVALLFLCAALIVHVVDRVYRVWPMGRYIETSFPGFITARGAANALKILVIVCAGAAIAYVIATLITS
jgi:hypothetical protein